MQSKSQSRKLRALLAISVLLIVLGSGNVIFGNYRAEVYEELLVEALESDAAPSLGIEGVPSEGPSEERDKTIRLLKGRLDFYRTVVIGGKCFLAMSGFILLYMLILTREATPEE
ncbi:MAG: hypothetical protein J5J00_01730 [Deltaproteobacteria bacterium]|nr:hypothetical protein [Deltaproteobacteria bacterium]